MADDDLGLDEGAEGAAEAEAAEDAVWETLGEESAAGESEPAAAPAPAPAPAGEPWADFMRPGETKEQALARVGEEARAASSRASAHYHDLKREREEMAAVAARLKAAEETYQRWREHFEAQAAKDLKADLPDPELEPERATLAEVRALRESMAAEAAARAETERVAAQTAEERAAAQAMWEADQAQFQAAAAALGDPNNPADPEADHEFRAAFTAIEGGYYRQLRFDYPNDPPEKILEAIGLLRTLDARKARARGQSYPDYLKERYRAIYGTPAAAAPATNGKPAGRPSVQDLERAAARAGKAAGMRRTPAGGGVKLPPSLEEFARMGEVEQARAIAAAEKRGENLEDELWASLGEEDGYG